MADFDYLVLDGDSGQLKIRAEDLGLDGNNVRILGHKFKSSEIGAIADPAATDETGSSTAIALLKGALRELIGINQNPGGSGPSYAEGATPSSVSVTPTETTVATIDCRGKSRLSITFENAGTTALDSFQTKIRTNSTFSFHFPEVTNAAGYTTNSSDQTGNATALIRKANGDPTGLTGGNYVWIRLNVEGVESIEFTATVATGGTTLNAWWFTE